MKSLFVLFVLLLALSCSAWLAASQMEAMQSTSGEATLRKLKVKGVKSIERDKSKPVRRAIEAWYDSNIQAFNAKDVAAIMALRTDDFHTITPDGKVNTRADMEAYTKRLLDRIDHFVSQDFQIGTIDLKGDLATAEVTQKTIRMQRLPDETLHKIEADAVQRETWKLTTEGWRLYKVDNVRSTGLFVDDKPYKPGSP